MRTLGRWTAGVLLVCGAVATAAQAAPVQDARRRAFAHSRKGQQHLAAERYDEAETEFRAALALVPSFTFAHYGLGQGSMARRRYADAVSHFEAARTAYRDEAAIRERGRMNQENRQDTEIMELRNMTQALNSAPAGSTSVQQQAATRRLAERLQQLERMRMRDNLAVDPVPPEISVALGSAYFRSNRLADAEREYLAALEVDPGIGEVHNNLAVVYMLVGRLDEAERYVALAEKANYKVSRDFKKELAAAIAKVPAKQ